MTLGTLLTLALALLALALVALALRASNAPQGRRHRQWWSPLLVLLYGWLLFRVRDRLPSAEEIAALLATIPALSVPADGALLEILQALIALLASQIPLLLIVLYIPVKRAAFLIHHLLRRPSLPGFWFYQRLDAGSVLRPEWSYSRSLFSGAALTAWALLLYPVAGFEVWGEVSELLPALSFLLLAETAWFLRGTPWQPDPLPRRSAAAAGEVDLEAVVRESKALFGHWLLAEQRLLREALPAPHSDSAQPCDDLELSGWSDACCLLLDDLSTGESVVVEGALPQQVEPCLGYHLRDRVLRGGRLLVLVPSLDGVAAARVWTERLLQQPGWPVLDWEGALDERPVAVVATLYHDLYRLLDERWGPDFDTVLIPDAHAGAYWFAAEIHALLGAMMDHSRSGRAPQVIAFADWRVDNEGVLRNLFGVPGKNRKLGKSEIDTSALLWRSEGRNEDGAGFQGGLFSAINAHITPEVALAYPAVREGARPQLVGQGRRPSGEAIDEASGAADAGQIDAVYGGPVRIEGRVGVYADDWEPQLAAHDPPVVIAFDSLYNLPATLRRWLPAAGGRSLVEVVSPPYLYREFFAARIALETAQPQRFTAFGPGTLSAEWAAAFTLFRRLERGWVDLERIRGVLRDVGVDPAEVRTRLAELFERHLALPGIRFVARSERHFDPEATPARFVQRSELRLSPAEIGARPRRPPWLEVIDIVGRERDAGAPQVLHRMHRGHLYQCCLEGQTHVFAGQPYLIERIDEHGVQARWIDSREFRAVQRQIRRVRLEAPAREIARHHPEVASTRTALHLTRFEMPLTVLTDGDYRWRPHDPLDPAAAEVFRSATIPERYDPHGKVLHLQLVGPAGIVGDGDAVDLTLAALLGEALPSYYPEAFPFLMVVPLRKPPAPKNGPHYLELLPGLEGNDMFARGLLLIEDSPFDLGLLQSLWGSLDGILADLTDYLAWRLEIGWQEQPFAPFGSEDSPVLAGTDDLLALLRALR